MFRCVELNISAPNKPNHHLGGGEQAGSALPKKSLEGNTRKHMPLKGPPGARRLAPGNEKK